VGAVGEVAGYQSGATATDVNDGPLAAFGGQVEPVQCGVDSDDVRTFAGRDP
jgi:hypothetical protein